MLRTDAVFLRKPSVAVLLTLCVGVGGSVAAQSQGSSADTSDASAKLSLDALSATRERPLFSPSRRPPRVVEVHAPPPAPPPAPRPPAPPAPPPALVFYGTFESPTEVGAAVQIPPNEKPTIVRYGTYIDGWRVTDINHRQLVLSREDRTAVFTLFSKDKTENQAVKPGSDRPSRLSADGANGAKRP
jgi:hypothetical protein